jgi:hypothetical protein
MARCRSSSLPPETCGAISTFGEPRRRRVFEFVDMDVEGGPAQMALFQRLGERLLVDDFAAREIDEDAVLFHGGKAATIEKPVVCGAQWQEIATKSGGGRRALFRGSL